MIRLLTFNLPYMAIPLIAYFVVPSSAGISEPLFYTALVCLVIEAAKASRVGAEAIFDAAISLALFILAGAVMLLYPDFQTATWRMLTAMAAADVLISMPVMINVARRDWGGTPFMGGN